MWRGTLSAWLRWQSIAAQDCDFMPPTIHTVILGQWIRLEENAGWSNRLQGKITVPCSLLCVLSLLPTPQQVANENSTGGEVLLFLPAQQRDKAAGYLGVFLLHVQALIIIQTEAQQQLLCIRVLSLPTFPSLWDEAAAHPENSPHSFPSLWEEAAAC